MKYFYLVLLTAVLSSCHNKFTEINGTTNGFISGTFIIKDDAGNTKSTGNIDDGKFHFRQIIDTIGFYHLRIKDDNYKDTRNPGYDVYLEPGTYTIVAQPEMTQQYPDIKSSSAIQTELSNYYTIANKLALHSEKLIAKSDSITGNVKKGSLLKLMGAYAGYNALITSKDDAMELALKEFVAKYPQNHVEAHIMAELDYTNDPVASDSIYQKFTDEQKKTTEGKEIGDKLSGMMKLAPGSVAPAIAGNTLTGAPFNPKSLHKDVVLVEFWRSDNDLSRANHNDLISSPFSPLNTESFTVVSVSLDNDAKAWKDAVKTDGMKWTQISDLKGDSSPVQGGSPNVSNWQVTTIPSYTLVDGRTWKIIKYNINYQDIVKIVNDYLQPGK